MPFDVIRASDRPNQTIHAAAVLHDNARSIAAACADASNGEVVLAIVSQDHAFRGIWTIPRETLAEHVAAYEDGGWSLVFSPGVGIDEIEERCMKLARLAFARWEAIRRWSSKHR
jgi:hypothetical protein